MSDISTLSPAQLDRRVEEFAQRIEFWLRAPLMNRVHFWETDSDARPYFNSAERVVQFTKSNCIAANPSSNSSLMDEFGKKLRNDWHVAQVSHLERVDVEALMRQYMVWIDQIFFFGLLTQPTRHEGKLVAGRNIINLKLFNILNDWSHGAVLDAEFVRTTGDLRMGLFQGSGEIKPFDVSVVCRVAHVLTYIYLYMLSRERRAEIYWRQLCQDNGHGVQFYELFYYIISQISQLAPCMGNLQDQVAKTYQDLQVARSKPRVWEDDAVQLIPNSPFKIKSME
ncbi:hypothetical protein F5Y16DRAFT_404590 [Xylariaceae sp. FL0255]|nr:hypothetical protein F5Y16DRAFT_404590 [Xylariaceae sp. FL0255]